MRRTKHNPLFSMKSSLVVNLLVVLVALLTNVYCLSSMFAGGARYNKVKVQDYRRVLENKGLSNWLAFERSDVQQGITHTEFYRRHSVQRLSRVPLIGRFFKPLAKVGIRTRSVPGQGNMEEFIRDQFNDKEKDIGLKLGLLVYMWVAPKWRGRNLGDMLLSVAVEQCQEKGDKYMLCVHDDTGSGKLVEWYKRRSFHPLPGTILEKGLIGSLCSPPAESEIDLTGLTFTTEAEGNHNDFIEDTVSSDKKDSDSYGTQD